MRRRLLSALGIAAGGLAVTWLLVRLRIPGPVTIMLWAVLVAALGLSTYAFVRALWLRLGTPHPAIGVLSVSLLLTLVSVPGCLMSPFVAATTVNHFRLADFERLLFEYPVPEGSRVVRTWSEVAVLTGNGDHCDYVATLVLAFERPPRLNRLRAHYAPLDLRPAAPSSPHPPSLTVTRGFGGLYAIYNRAATGDSTAHIAVVEVVDSGYPAGFSLGCF